MTLKIIYINMYICVWLLGFNLSQDSTRRQEQEEQERRGNNLEEEAKGSETYSYIVCICLLASLFAMYTI